MFVSLLQDLLKVSQNTSMSVCLRQGPGIFKSLMKNTMCVSLLKTLQNHSQETECLFAPAEDLEYSKVYLWRDMSVSRL